MAFSEEMVQQIWEKGRAIPNIDPNTWRKDQCGAWLKRSHYENRNSEYGWVIENVSPGDPDEIANLQALHWQNRVERGVGRAKCKVTAEPHGIKNNKINCFLPQRVMNHRGGSQTFTFLVIDSHDQAWTGPLSSLVIELLRGITNLVDSIIVGCRSAE